METRLEEKLYEKTTPKPSYRTPYDPMELKERVQYNKKQRFQKTYR